MRVERIILYDPIARIVLFLACGYNVSAIEGKVWRTLTCALLGPRSRGSVYPQLVYRRGGLPYGSDAHMITCHTLALSSAAGFFICAGLALSQLRVPGRSRRRMLSSQYRAWLSARICTHGFVRRSPGVDPGSAGGM